MAAPVLSAASVTILNGSNQAARTISNIRLSAAGNNRILVLAAVYKGNFAPIPTISTIAVDPLGVNRTIGSGVTEQGSRQDGTEGDFSSHSAIYICLESDLPTAAGDYDVDIVLSKNPQYNMWAAYEVTGAQQVIDAVQQGSSTADVSGGALFSDSIISTVADCLIVDHWATSHSSAPSYTSTETFVTSISNTNGGGVVSQTNRAIAGAQLMEQSSSTFHQRRAWSLLSFAPIATGISGSGNLNSDSSLLSGNGVRRAVGIGATPSKNAMLAGVGDRHVNGLGDAASNSATLAGSGLIGGKETAIGEMVSGLAIATGSGLRVAVAIGSTVAQPATMLGSGIVGALVVGLGALNSANSSAVGSATRGIINTLISQQAKLSAVGHRHILGSAIFNAGLSVIEGAGGVPGQAVEGRGLEYTLNESKMHYTLSATKLHYTF